MRRTITQNARLLPAIFALAAVGIAISAYILAHERLPHPFAENYEVNIELSSAVGVAPGLGQPVQVAGVKIGTIAGAHLHDGIAIVTLRINRGELPHVYRDATVALRPVTPLYDMEVDLNPGSSAAGAIPDGGTLPLGQTSSPVPLEDLLSALDADTRTFLGSMIESLGTGTRERGLDIRRLLLTLGPTTAQLHQITAALAARQLAIERLVHNLAVVTRAAGQDRQLSSLIQAGNTTLQTLADQDAPLRQSLSELPSTLATAETTLRNARPLAKELSPTLLSLTPAANALPSVFASLGPYATLASSIIRRQIRPFVTSTLPLARNLSPAVRQLAGMTPDLEKSFRVLNYWLNETAYNPGGDNPGYLFWLPWGVHNLNSVFSVQDAHGGVGQGIALVACKSASAGGQALGATLATVLNTSGLCNNK